MINLIKRKIGEAKTSEDRTLFRTILGECQLLDKKGTGINNKMVEDTLKKFLKNNLETIRLCKVAEENGSNGLRFNIIKNLEKENEEISAILPKVTTLTTLEQVKLEIARMIDMLPFPANANSNQKFGIVMKYFRENNIQAEQSLIRESLNA